MDNSILKLVTKIAFQLKTKQLHLATAESCTGGLLAAAITELPGSSEYFDRGFVVYSETSKHEELGISYRMLKKFGAVSREIAKVMAKRVLLNSHAEITIAITGFAGPTASPDSLFPPGIVFFAAIYNNKVTEISKHFSGNRNQIRNEAVKFALKLLLTILKSET